nr:hypothetical protein [Tanacetum cinerariifolium]
MSRDILTVGSTMRIPLLYRGEYSQWVERFMNYLEEQTDGEAMINSIKNGLTSRNSVKNIMRTSYQSLWTRFAVTSENRSMLESVRPAYYSPSTTKSTPGRTNSRDHPRGRSRPHKLDASNEGCPKDREHFCGVGESYDDSYSHSYHDKDRSRHM